MADNEKEIHSKEVTRENGVSLVGQYIEDIGGSNEKEPMLSSALEMQSLKNQTNIVQKTALKRMLTHDLELRFKDEPLTDETTCGYWILRGKFFQRFANKKAYVLLYGLSGCIFSATYAYFNATITTLEKRYKIPSKTVGFIGVGNDISSLFLSAALSYYAGKGHRPRWVAFGILTISIFCILTSLPHFIYGPGQEAILLTTEFGARFDDDTTFEIMEKERSKSLCQTNNSTIAKCEVSEGSLAPQVILFIAQLIAGIGGSLYYTLGASYMDDNIQKSKTPALISFSYFLRTLGPAFGYTVASFCLNIYISPDLTPTIKTEDPRWLGAWWMGWLLLGVILAFCSILLSLFPHTLPRAAIRRKIQEERKRLGEKVDEPIEEKPSFKDMLTTFKRLLKNKILMFNHFASVFYFFGYMPYWIFLPKIIETQYKQSASVSSLVTGTVALAFSAIGILSSGLVISKFKPRARYLAAWNVLVGLFSVIGIISYIFLGCKANENSIVVNDEFSGAVSCNRNCHCDYVKYSPVCGENGQTYISPCHAGCKNQTTHGSQKIYTECSCISPMISKTKILNDSWNMEKEYNFVATDILTAATFRSDLSSDGIAIANACPIDCQYQFYMFLIVMCFIKFTGATGRASNFLVGVRCVDEKDKTASMGFGLMIMALFAFIPSPIYFGGLMDKYCILWGKTCSGKGNCWLYDNESLRIWLNFIAACFVFIGTVLDAGVWYYAKDLKIFDEEINEIEKEIAVKEEEVIHDKV